MRQQDRCYDALEVLLAARGDKLLATAVLLTGRRDAGEDLLQHALERVMRQWSRVEGDPEGYLRRTMYHLAVDRWRQLARRREVYGTDLTMAVGDGAEEFGVRDALVRALAQLPPRQRAVLVLRYFEECSEAETAVVLGCSVGTVKSSASRALARLREVTGTDLELRPSGQNGGVERDQH